MSRRSCLFLNTPILAILPHLDNHPMSEQGKSYDDIKPRQFAFIYPLGIENLPKLTKQSHVPSLGLLDHFHCAAFGQRHSIKARHGSDNRALIARTFIEIYPPSPCSIAWVCGFTMLRYVHILNQICNRD